MELNLGCLGSSFLRLGGGISKLLLQISTCSSPYFSAEKYGEEQVLIWRRSFDIPPPSLKNDDPRHPRFNSKFDNIKNYLPSGESLKDVIERLKPFWSEYQNRIMNRFQNNLIK